MDDESQEAVTTAPSIPPWDQVPPFLMDRYVTEDETGIRTVHYPHWLPSSGFFTYATIEELIAGSSEVGPSSVVYVVFMSDSTGSPGKPSKTAYVGMTRRTLGARWEHHARDRGDKDWHKMAAVLDRVPEARGWKVKAMSRDMVGRKLRPRGPKPSLETAEVLCKKYYQPMYCGSSGAKRIPDQEGLL